MSDLNRSIEFLRDLIAFPSVSSDSNLNLIAFLGEVLGNRGARTMISRDETGTKANLFATIGPDLPGGIMLSGHTDVVPIAEQDWSTDPFEMVEGAGRLYGRGTCDMKGFIAAALALADSINPQRLKRPLHFAFTYDEEVGCIGARQLVDDLREHDIMPDITIIGEPTEMRIIEGHKGCCEYTAHFTGLEGHGSAPDNGVNAAEYAVRYVGKLLELREELKSRAPGDSVFDPPWTTMNIGRVSGGVAHNVIVGKAEVEWEMRPVQDSDVDFVKTALKDYCDKSLLPAMRAVHDEAEIFVETIGEIAGLKPMPQNAARDLVAELTGRNATDLVAFGTEAGLFQTLGSDVVVCGPGSIAQAHKPDEFLEIDQMRQCCDMLTKLGEKLSA